MGHGSEGESHVKDSRVDRREKELEQSHWDVNLNLTSVHPWCDYQNVAKISFIWDSLKILLPGSEESWLNHIKSIKETKQILVLQENLLEKEK